MEAHASERCRRLLPEAWDGPVRLFQVLGLPTGSQSLSAARGAGSLLRGVLATTSQEPNNEKGQEGGKREE